MAQAPSAGIRWLAVAAVVLLAGCASTGDGPAPLGREAPIADSADGLGNGTAGNGTLGTGETHELEDRGTMVYGVDENWTFPIRPGAVRIDIHLSALPIEGNQQLMGLEAKLYRNGTLHEDGSVQGFQGSYGGSGGTDLIKVSERAEAVGDLASFAGGWELVLEGGHQMADYEMKVRIVY